MTPSVDTGQIRRKHGKGAQTNKKQIQQTNLQWRQGSKRGKGEVQILRVEPSFPRSTDCSSDCRVQVCLL